MGYPPPAPPKKKSTGKVVLAAVGGFLALCCVGGVISAGEEETKKDAIGAALPSAVATTAAPASAAPLATTAEPTPSPTSATPTTPPPPQTAKVPDLKGENAAVAEDTLRNLGFTKIKFGSADEDDKVVLLLANWTVKKQSATAGKKLPLDTLIVLTCTKQ